MEQELFFKIFVYHTMKKKILFCYFFLLAVLLSAQNKIVLNKLQLDSTQSIALNKFWKFNNGDDSTWKNLSFDDSKWDTTNTSLRFDKNDVNIFKGIAWFRIHIYIDSSLNDTPLSLLIDQDGASQLFLDGKLIHSLGKISNNTKKEKEYNPNEIPISFRYNKSGEHLLAVRYSNLAYKKNYEKYGTNNPGFTIEISEQDGAVKNAIIERITSTSLGILMGVFFLSLGFVHLLFFLFYKKHSTNLYYSIFVFLFAGIFLVPTMSLNVFNSQLSILLNYCFRFFLVLFFYALLLLHHSLFQRPYGKYFWFSTVILILIIISAFININSEYLQYLIFGFIISTVIASFFMVVKSIRGKLDGAKIIGTGSLLFLLFLAFIIIRIMINNNFNVNSLLGITLIALAFMSIPVSMSIYLARQFAQTNKNLEKQLIEVETLSAKTIEQEKEKQKMLETQKEVLEVQVKERTSEIFNQKTIIEQKNKDITDSINYAKTIQEAILPPKELKHQLFPDSFILFKPKDIVSGDFYWFTEKDNKKIIAACDCTGHGVPGALMSMIGNNVINHIVNEQGIITPNEILNHLHKEIHHTLNQEKQNETRDGMDIALISFNSDTEIEFAGAQRPLWIIKNNDNNTLVEIKGDKYAIGGAQTEEERKFNNHQITVAKGDCIYIFSDGYADQFSSENKKLMTSQFKTLLISIQEKTMPEQEKFLDDFIENWKGNREQIDDILVIGIRV